MDDFTPKELRNKKRNTTLTFGKYKGSDLSEIPLSYLGWLLREYSGSSLAKEDIEAEAISRGCEKRNGKWGIVRSRGYSDNWDLGAGFDLQQDFLGNTVVRRMKDNLEDLDYGEDCYDYEGIPNMD